jgi:hypothetical protein
MLFVDPLQTAGLTSLVALVYTQAYTILFTICLGCSLVIMISLRSLKAKGLSMRKEHENDLVVDKIDCSESRLSLQHGETGTLLER